MAEGDISVPFGKYQNEWVCDIPTAYLEWLVSTQTIRSKELQKHVNDELTYRAAKGNHSRGLADRQAFLTEEDAVQGSGNTQTVSGRDEQLRAILQQWQGATVRELTYQKDLSDPSVSVAYKAYQRSIAELQKQLLSIGLKVEFRL